MEAQSQKQGVNGKEGDLVGDLIKRSQKTARKEKEQMAVGGAKKGKGHGEGAKQHGGAGQKKADPKGGKGTQQIKRQLLLPFLILGQCHERLFICGKPLRKRSKARGAVVLHVHVFHTSFLKTALKKVYTMKRADAVETGGWEKKGVFPKENAPDCRKIIWGFAPDPIQGTF